MAPATMSCKLAMWHIYLISTVSAVPPRVNITNIQKTILDFKKGTFGKKCHFSWKTPKIKGRWRVKVYIIMPRGHQHRPVAVSAQRSIGRWPQGYHGGGTPIAGWLVWIGNLHMVRDMFRNTGLDVPWIHCNSLLWYRWPVSSMVYLGLPRFTYETCSFYLWQTVTNYQRVPWHPQVNGRIASSGPCWKNDWSTLESKRGGWTSEEWGFRAQNQWVEHGRT